MNRLGVIAAGIGLAIVASTPFVHADELNKRTVLTIDKPIQVPNMVLPAGKYVIRLRDSLSDRQVVQIYNATEQHLITTILAMPNYRLKQSERTVLTFWEMPPGQPPALRAWFYPGDKYGREFAYTEPVARQIAAVSHAPVPTVEMTKSKQMANRSVSAVALISKEH